MERKTWKRFEKQGQRVKIKGEPEWEDRGAYAEREREGERETDTERGGSISTVADLTRHLHGLWPGLAAVSRAGWAGAL